LEAGQADGLGAQQRILQARAASMHERLVPAAIEHTASGYTAVTDTTAYLGLGGRLVIGARLLLFRIVLVMVVIIVVFPQRIHIMILLRKFNIDNPKVVISVCYATGDHRHMQQITNLSARAE